VIAGRRAGNKEETLETRNLLAIDAVVNLLLGGVLLCSPAGSLRLLGLPSTQTYFYASILGAVIFGIGVALAAEFYGAPHGVRGLGLGGAIAINLCGGGALVLWLLFVPLDIPTRGFLVLWSIAVLVLGIGIVELLTRSWKHE
jgi:hypothetical protein